MNKLKEITSKKVNFLSCNAVVNADDVRKGRGNRSWPHMTRSGLATYDNRKTRDDEKQQEMNRVLLILSACSKKKKSRS